MSVKNLVFTIKVPPWGAAAQKDAGKLTTELKTQDKATKTLVEATKKHAKGLGEAANEADKLGRAGTNAARSIGSAMASASGHVARFTGGIEGAIRKVVNFKSLLLGTVAGAGAYKLGSTIFHEGFQQLAAEGRARREFGKDAPGLVALSNKIGLRAGIQGDEALRGMTPLIEAIQETAVKGATFGGKRIKTDADIARARAGATGMAGKLYQRLALLNPDMDPTEIGRLLAAAGTGKEGLRGFGSAFGINKAITARISKEGEKKHMGQGDIVERLMASAGMTEEAENAKVKTFQYQIKSIGNQLTDSLGDVGKSAVEALNKKFGEGETLAQKLTKSLASPEGQKAIEKMGDGLAKMVGFAADLALKIPAAFSWIEDHKGTLLAVAAGYGGLKVIGGASSLLGKIPGAGALAGKRTGDATAMPVRVVNWGESGGSAGVGGAKSGASLLQKAGMVAGAGALGFAVGTALDKVSGGRLSGGLASALDGGAGAVTEKLGVDAHRGKLASIAAARNAKIAALEASGMDRGHAIAAADGNRTAQPIQVNVHIDGQVAARAIATHVARDAKNATAGGAAR